MMVGAVGAVGAVVARTSCPVLASAAQIFAERSHLSSETCDYLRIRLVLILAPAMEL